MAAEEYNAFLVVLALALGIQVAAASSTRRPSIQDSLKRLSGILRFSSASTEDIKSAPKLKHKKG